MRTTKINPTCNATRAHTNVVTDPPAPVFGNVPLFSSDVAVTVGVGDDDAAVTVTDLVKAKGVPAVVLPYSTIV